MVGVRHPKSLIFSSNFRKNTIASSYVAITMRCARIFFEAFRPTHNGFLTEAKLPYKPTKMFLLNGKQLIYDFFLP